MLYSVYDDFSKMEAPYHAIAKLLSNALSIGTYASQSIIQEAPLNKYVFDNFKDVMSSDQTITKLAFCIFKCGKTMNSKVKFERFFLIINNKNIKKEELFILISKIYSSIRKFLATGKQGELGMRLNNEGSYYPPNDSLNDVIKIMEEIIKDSGDTRLSIGIDCNANNYFNETTKKYEMDGFKQPPDADPLIDFYLKFCNDHPLITYLEDPISDSDLIGWKKVYQKFEAKPNVTISCKNLINENSNKLRSLTELRDLDDPNNCIDENEKVRVLEINKHLEEENSKKLTFNNISFRLNECITISEIFESYRYIKTKLSNRSKSIGVTIWDNGVESDQSVVIDIALGLRANIVVLHGINNRNERINKINRYLDIVEELY